VVARFFQFDDAFAAPALLVALFLGNLLELLVGVGYFASMVFADDLKDTLAIVTAPAFLVFADSLLKVRIRVSRGGGRLCHAYLEYFIITEFGSAIQAGYRRTLGALRNSDLG